MVIGVISLVMHHELVIDKVKAVADHFAWTSNDLNGIVAVSILLSRRVLMLF